jgi:hypothetical protein
MLGLVPAIEALKAVDQGDWGHDIPKNVTNVGSLLAKVNLTPFPIFQPDLFRRASAAQ